MAVSKDIVTEDQPSAISDQSPLPQSDPHRQYLRSLGRRHMDRFLRGDITADDLIDLFVAVVAAKEKRINQDPKLKNFFNKAAFERILGEEIEKISKLKLKPGALLFIDIDKFKNFNDTYGHPAGDKMIAFISQKIKEATRATDLLGRIGGDEFAVFLVDTDTEGAKVVAGRIRGTITETAKEEFPNLSWEQTVSIGIAVATPDDNHLTLLKKSDQALYQAKQGRNRFAVWEKPVTAG